MTLPALETPRPTLRSITAHDPEGLHEAYADADAMRHWNHPPSQDVSNHHAHNEQQRRLAAKPGFTDEGTLREWLCVAGEFRSVAMYSLPRAEWMAQFEALSFPQRSHSC